MEGTLAEPQFGILDGMQVGTVNLFPQISGTNTKISENSFIAEELKSRYEKALSEWTSLVGEEEFFALPKEKQEFLINTAGVFDFQQGIDIYDAYRYSIYS